MDAGVFLHWRTLSGVGGVHAVRSGAGRVRRSAWVGLIGFRMQGAGLGRGPGPPFFGSFNEINVRLYSREPDGARGVVFLSLDATRLAVVLAARAAGIPYVWSRAGFRPAGDLDPVAGGRSVGAAPVDRGSTSVFRPAVPGRRPERFCGYPGVRRRSHPPLSLHLTARFGLHSRFRGRTLYIPNTHSAWPLYRAELRECWEDPRVDRRRGPQT